MKSALIIGEALIDGVIRPGKDVVEHPGGSPANVALGLARLGRSVDLATWFGTDPHGAQLRTHFKIGDVRVVPGSDRATRTSTAFATLDDTGAATYEFDLEWQVPEVHLDSGVGLVHVGSIASILQPGADGVLEIVRAAAKFATISYDPNLRPTIMGERDDVRERVELLVGAADVVKVSDEDLRWLYPEEVEEEVVRRWAALGPSLLVLTRGGAGAMALTSAGLELEMPAPRVTVVDTVGAGDSFTSGLLDALWTADLLGASRRERLREIDPSALHAAMQWSVHNAAITVSRAGANPPRRSEVIESIDA